MGVSDPECTRLPGRAFTASALRNLLPADSSTGEPDLVIPRSSKPVDEYHNPDLVPGMFPTLYPFGIGGFDDNSRVTSLGFQNQANYNFDLADRSFRYHRSYMFVILNIFQRRTAHLHTHFTVRRSHFETLARRLTSVSPHTLTRLADQLQKEHKYSNLGPDDRNALNLLNQVNTVAARIPGSQSSKMFVRSEIRSYFGFFGMPHLFFTCNLSASHSPTFQLMFGDTTVDLTQHYPCLVPARERAIRLARDPVAAADFFHFSFKCIFTHLFGWDFDTQASTERGGILGHLEAFYGTSE
ncbi:hypothetical protein DEU56DRAFT_744956, partial [Suillus clintonianus]|uniref:uncharacterized protein n=1 Tax=Suillus clintonianus TaxID=1904413 RepID=UPI001B864BFA